jgi:hypothetical protein
MNRALLKRLLVSLLLIIAGSSAIGVPAYLSPDWFRGPSIGFAIAASGTLVGAGIGTIFKQPLWGAIFGFCVAIGLIIFGQSPRE